MSVSLITLFLLLLLSAAYPVANSFCCDLLTFGVSLDLYFIQFPATTYTDAIYTTITITASVETL